MKHIILPIAVTAYGIVATIAAFSIAADRDNYKAKLAEKVQAFNRLEKLYYQPSPVESYPSPKVEGNVEEVVNNLAQGCYIDVTGLTYDDAFRKVVMPRIRNLELLVCEGFKGLLFPAVDDIDELKARVKKLEEKQ